jgi:hypothetical protein
MALSLATIGVLFLLRQHFGAGYAGTVILCCCFNNSRVVTSKCCLHTTVCVDEFLVLADAVLMHMQALFDAKRYRIPNNADNRGRRIKS